MMTNVMHHRRRSAASLTAMASSAYRDSPVALNASLAKAGKPPVRIVAVSDELEDEDILEMVNAGIIPATIVNEHLADFWGKIFDQIRLQPAALRTDGQIAWALRRGTPQLRQAVNDFAAAHGKGTLAYNVIFQKYFRNTKWVTSPASEAEMKKFRDTDAQVLHHLQIDPGAEGGADRRAQALTW